MADQYPHQPWCRLSREPLPDHPMIGAARCRCNDGDMEAAYLKGRASSTMAQPTAGPYSIGSDVWPGLSKLAEESGEVVQVIGKIVADEVKRTIPELADYIRSE